MPFLNALVPVNMLVFYLGQLAQMVM